MKKGTSNYIGWVLLIAFAFILGSFMYSWTINKVETSNDNLEGRTDTVFCEGVSINIYGMCQNSQSLYMNVTNTNNQKITKLGFSMIDIYDEPTAKSKIIDLATSEEYTGFFILKQGTLKQVRVIPFAKKENRDVIRCQESSIIIENIKQC